MLLAEWFFSYENGIPAKRRNKLMAEEYLLVDGYNIIFAWQELKAAAENISLEAARHRLLTIMANYQGLTRKKLIVVFDAHHVKNGVEKVERHHELYVVFTKEAETADNYIERVVGYLARHYRVTVATSDTLEQIIILGRGATRISAEAFLTQVQSAEEKMREKYIEKRPIKKNQLTDHLDPETAALIEKMRRNETD